MYEDSGLLDVSTNDDTDGFSNDFTDRTLRSVPPLQRGRTYSRRVKRTKSPPERRVTPQERHFLVVEVANWPYYNNYRTSASCCVRGACRLWLLSLWFNPRRWAVCPRSSGPFRDRAPAYVIRLILSNLISKRTGQGNDRDWPLSLFLSVQVTERPPLNFD